MSSDTLTIDAYFDSEKSALRIEEAFTGRGEWASEASLERLAELGFEDVEVLREWFDVSCGCRGRRLTLAFEAASSDRWEVPLIDFLTARGASHILVDFMVGSAGEREEYGYIAGVTTPLGRLMKELQAIDPDVALAEAVQRNRMGNVKNLLAAGADPNGGKVPYPVTAVRAEGPRVLELLLKAGADVDQQVVETGDAALHACAGLGEHEIRDQLAELLLRHDADPNLRNAEGWSPLLLAADHGSARLSQRLLEHGGDPNARHQDGRTVAMVAASAGNDGLGVLRALEAHGADLAAVDRQGRSLFFHALPRIELENYLLARGIERCVPDQEYTGDPTPDLFTAIRFGNTEKAEELVRDRELANAEFNPELERTFITALYLATYTERDEIVELLLQQGADPDVPSGYGTVATPLWTAVKKGNGRIVAALLAAGADPDAGWSDLETPLMAAVAGGHLEVVQMLLDAGSDPKAERRHKSVIEYVKGSTEEARAVFELLAGVVPLDVTTGYKLLEKAIVVNDLWLLARLVPDGVAARGSDLGLALSRDDLGGFELLLSLFVGDPKALPLLSCCQQLVRAKGPRREHLRPIFERLLEMGADPEQPAPSHETPLATLQLKKGFVRETQALLASGANPNRLVPQLLGGRLHGDFSALHMAAYYGLVENAKALIDAGAEVDLESNSEHGTALLIAKARGKKKMIQLLVERGAVDVEPAVPVRDLSLVEAKRRFVEVSKTSPYVLLEKRPDTQAPPVEGLAPELAELFSRYQRVIVFDGPPDEDNDEMNGLDAALFGPMEGLDGYLRIGGGPHHNLFTTPGEDTVYPQPIDGPDPPHPYPSFYHWALAQIEWAEMVADL